jgi:hypothetical protein
MHTKIKIHYSWLHKLLQIAATIEHNQLHQPHTHTHTAENNKNIHANQENMQLIKTAILQHYKIKINRKNIIHFKYYNIAHIRLEVTGVISSDFSASI